MSIEARIRLARELVEVFKNQSRAAHAVGVPVQTFQYWFVKGVPKLRVRDVRDAAKRHKVRLPSLAEAA